MADPQAAAPVAPEPGTPAHDAAMAAKFDANASAHQPPAPVDPAPTVVERPAHVPEKFWDAKTGSINTEAWAKSTLELEAKLSGKPATPPADPTKPITPPTGDPSLPPGATPITPVEMEGFNAEFASKGALSDESFAALEAKGLSRAYVENYIAGQVALQQVARNEALAVVGGEEAYGKIASWASTSLSPAELAAFNEVVEGPSKEARSLALSGLKARFEAANGTTQNGMIQAGGGAPGALQGYQSNAEMMRDMRDPKYRSDPAFRRMVESKLNVSTNLGSVSERS